MLTERGRKREKDGEGEMMWKKKKQGERLLVDYISRRLMLRMQLSRQKPNLTYQKAWVQSLVPRKVGARDTQGSYQNFKLILQFSLC